MIDSKLVERIDGLSTTPFDGVAYRHVSHGRDPLDTIGSRVHGGRWNPPNSFGAVYLALDVDTVAAELGRAAAAQNLPLAAFVPRTLWRIRLRTGPLLDLQNHNATDAAGLGSGRLFAAGRRPCQMVGEVAHYLGLEGVVAPSATGSGIVIAVFADRLGVDSILEPLDAQDDWRP